jgi:hypothetical protein
MRKTTQAAFHPMLGHVEDGCEIACSNGDTLTVRPSIRGWCLINQRGEQVGRDMNAWQLADAVVSHGGIE